MVLRWFREEEEEEIKTKKNTRYPRESGEALNRGGVGTQPVGVAKRNTASPSASYVLI